MLRQSWHFTERTTVVVFPYTCSDEWDIQFSTHILNDILVLILLRLLSMSPVLHKNICIWLFYQVPSNGLWLEIIIIFNYYYYYYYYYYLPSVSWIFACFLFLFFHSSWISLVPVWHAVCGQYKLHRTEMKHKGCEHLVSWASSLRQHTGD